MPTIIIAAVLLVQSVTFSHQGPEALISLTGKRIPGIALTSVTVCAISSSAPLNIQVGRIYQMAIQQGLTPLSPPAAKSLIIRTVRMNWRTIAVEAIADLGIAAVVLGSSGAISMSSSWVTGMAVGHTFFDSLSGRIKTRIPDPTPIFDALPSPRDAVTVPSNGCAEFLLVTRWKKGMPESLGPIQLK